MNVAEAISGCYNAPMLKRAGEQRAVDKLIIDVTYAV